MLDTRAADIAAMVVEAAKSRPWAQYCASLAERWAADRPIMVP
jgi:hypothetical protein